MPLVRHGGRRHAADYSRPGSSERPQHSGRLAAVKRRRDAERSGADTVSHVPEIIWPEEGALLRPFGVDEHDVKEGEAL